MEFNKNFDRLLKKAIALGTLGSLMTCTVGTGFTSFAADDLNTSGPTVKTTSTSAAVSEAKPKTNVIYIVLDDIGFSDLGSFGSEIKTPNIDLLAENGLRYNNFNACPLSSPTRASLLTGRENNSVGMGQIANISLGADRPNLQGKVIPEAGNVAEILKEQGYSTFAIGKWHLAPAYTITPAGPFTDWPLSKGFDRFYGFMDGETDQYKPQLVSGNEQIAVPKNTTYNLNDDLLVKSKKFIADHSSVYPNRPFFMTYNFGTGHSPQQVPKKYIDQYKNVYDSGWDSIHLQRFAKQKKLGIIPAGSILPASDPTIKAWDKLSANEKKLYARFMENYAGYITQADEEVGKLVGYLKELGQFDNTMIVLIGDNGATNLGGPDGTDSFLGALSAGKFPSVDDLLKKYNAIGTADMQALYPAGWAQVSNTPFKNYKGSLYAGALRNPLIISWPAGIQSKGEIRNQYVHVADITPTVLDILNVDAPASIKGITQMPMYGTSIASTFANLSASEVRTSAIFYSQPNRAFYANGWKALALHKPGTSFEDDVWELYNVNEDYTESNNVAAKNPEILAELKNRFMTEASQYKILPLKESAATDMLTIKPDSAAFRNTFKYYPGVGQIGIAAAPPVNLSNFTITAPVTLYKRTNEGVLAAMGDNMGGYSLYIKNNKLVFTYNRFGEVFKLTSSENIPLGKSTLKFDFKRTSLITGDGTLYINDKAVANGPFKTNPLISAEGLDIGKDTLLQVDAAYKEQNEFPFSGKLSYVQFDMSRFIPQSAPKN